MAQSDNYYHQISSMILDNSDLPNMAHPEDSGDQVTKPRDFLIPCLTKLEDLLKAHPNLDIEQSNFIGTRLRIRENVAPNVTDGTNSTVNSRSSADRDSKTSQPKTVALKIKLRPKRGQPIKNDVKIDNQPKTNGKRKASEPAKQKQQTVSSEAIKGDDKSFANGRPGTAGSRQVLTTSTGKPRNTQNQMQNMLIHTNDMVDETIVYSLREICQRANINPVPSSARSICTPFCITIHDLDLTSPPKDDEREKNSIAEEGIYETGD